ncbi:MAG: OmpH family outer membrane protein [Desulfovibrionaceae bacterium]
MRKFPLLCALLLALGLMPACTDTATAESIGVVNTNRILTESQPAKAGEAHLKKVQGVLQKGLDDLQKMYKGKEKTPQAQQAIREGYAALEQQMAAEKQAVLQVLGKALDKAVKEWRADNKKILVVVSQQVLLDADASVDVTSAVMQEMNQQKPEFPALPTVKVNPPPKEEAKAAPKRR